MIAGVDVFRLNFSHGTHEGHQMVIQHICSLNEECDRHVGILADLQGPKLRIGDIENEPLELKNGDIINFVNEKCLGTKDKIYMSYAQLAQDVEPNEIILLDDGKIVLQVVETNKTDTVKLQVVHGGLLKSRKGVNLPDTKIALPALTEKDLIDLEFLLTQPVNWIALSFVRSGDDIKELQKRIDAKGHPAKVVAKIEKPEAIINIEKIIKASHGIMIARGDLGIEVPIERLPLLQKNIIKKCVQAGKPVIVATQMLETMMENPTPSRPEVTDVANAVMDGADAVMLSGETASGKFPVRVVETMSQIINVVESDPGFEFDYPKLKRKSKTYRSDVICLNAVKVAKEVEASAIIGMTVSGYTAFRVSSCRPRTNIFIFSDRLYMLATLNLVWGVKCFYYSKFSSTDETVDDVINLLKKRELLKTGDVVINIGSMPLYKRLMTNMLRLTEVE
jgi:pyruvate kinase